MFWFAGSLDFYTLIYRSNSERVKENLEWSRILSSDSCAMFLEEEFFFTRFPDISFFFFEMVTNIFAFIVNAV